MSDLVLFEKDNLEKIYKATDTLSKSSLIPFALRGKSSDIFAILVMGNELGIPPMQSLNSIDVIQGNPTLSTQLMVALVRSKFPSCKISYFMDEDKELVECSVWRSYEKDTSPDYVSTWNKSKATKMKLIGKDNYQKQLMTMLRTRATAEAMRVVFPDALMGLHASEEFQDIDGKEVREVENLNAEIDEDFPQPINETTLGHEEYRIMYGTKGRGKQLKDMSVDSLEEILVMIEKRSTGNAKIPHWHADLKASVSLYLETIGE